MTTSRENLIRRANDFCERHKIKLTTLGRHVVNDGNFFIRINSGGDCTTGNYDKFMAYFDSDGKKIPK